MPGSITHTYIAYLCFQEAATKVLFKSPVLSDILTCHNRDLLRLARDGVDSYQKYVDSRDNNIILPSFAYIGCNGPDIYYMARGNPDQNGKPGADILHYNKTGPNVIWALRELKGFLSKHGDIDFPMKFRLAYWLGHISHIAADVTVHPFINSIAAAYPDDYCDAKGNSRFRPFGGWGKYSSVFKFHNVVEHWQDAYILRRVLIPKVPPLLSVDTSLPRANFQNWRSVNLCARAATHLLNHREQYFILRNLQYYGYLDTNELDSIGISIKDVQNYTNKNKFETEKFQIMSTTDSTRLPPDVDWYIEQVLPPERQVEMHLEAHPKDNFVQPQVVQKYILRAVDFTLRLWKEVDNYFTNTSIDVNKEDEYDMSESKKCFPYLRRHWNLDTGFSPRISVNDDKTHAAAEYEPMASIDSKNKSFEVHLPFLINYESYPEDRSTIDDIAKS